MLEALIDNSRVPVFFCIGTTKCLCDSVGPRIGDSLAKLGYLVHGTSKDQWHAKTIARKHKEIYEVLDLTKYQPIAIDFSYFDSLKEDFNIKVKSINPGSGANKKLPPIGEISIRVNAIKMFEKQISNDEHITDFIKYYLALNCYFDNKVEESEIDILHNIVDSVVTEIENTYRLKESCLDGLEEMALLF